VWISFEQGMGETPASEGGRCKTAQKATNLKTGHYNPGWPPEGGRYKTYL